ncbi:MAG: aryldialkylphosphatase [Chloroflexi bacterium]|nr:aryldialkylphosphatase [Chloroflexota bacterium]
MSDVTGKALTVRGPVEPDRLGPTLMHEHLFVDLRKSHPPYQRTTDLEVTPNYEVTKEEFPATELALWGAPLGLGNLHLARAAAPIADNYLLADEELATKEVMEYKNHGGGTIVDVTSIGLKRDPLALRRVSEATGLNIVMGASWYQKLYHPSDMDERTVEEMTDEIVRDVTVGVDGTDVRSGIIGEVGVNGRPIIENEVKSVRASARASSLTGAAISFHGPMVAAEKHRVLDIVEEEGADLGRVVMGHSDSMAYDDLPLAIELLSRGVYIELDMIGRETVLGLSLTAKDVVSIPKLIAAGYEDRIVLSHDVCWKTQLKYYGGSGYSFILEKFLPHLRETGVTNEQIDKMMVENPRRILTFVEPR